MERRFPPSAGWRPPGTLGFVWDIYLDWGISVMDYRGAIKNPGTKIDSPLV